MSLSVTLPAFVLLVLLASRGAQAQDPCTDTLSCTAVGYFARCEDFCDTQYFTCETVGEPATLFTCPGETVFDYDPDYPYCVPFSECEPQNCSTLTIPCQGFDTYPMCNYCNQEFYVCLLDVGEAQSALCDTGMLYNPIPSLGGCVPESECPCTSDDC